MMKTPALRPWFRTVLKQLSLLLVSLIMALGLIPVAAQAVPFTPGSPQLTLALTASSRFATPSDEDLDVQQIPEGRLEELRAQRREWQSEVSAAAYDAAEQAEDAEETVKEKLNLEEIIEDNEILNSD